VYSPHYRVDIGPHVFPTAKYDLLRRRLIDEFNVPEVNFVEPEPASIDQILGVHTRRYYTACRDSSLTLNEQRRLELPWSTQLFDAATRCVGGSIIAARLALNFGVGLHIGGGFHHAFADHGEGFCVFNDTACAIRQMQAEKRIKRAMVVDVDLHQGNGTSAIFTDDESVATFSIHQEWLYPYPKPPSTVDIGLDTGTDDTTYLNLLEAHLLPLVNAHQPDLVLYVAGADPYRYDQLGALNLTINGLRKRDQFICNLCHSRRLPLAVVLAGGYARNTEDTVQIHLGTLQEAALLWRGNANDSVSKPA
jgi:acetoin utilization deacetylase AcuC-like enzyme